MHARRIHAYLPMHIELEVSILKLVPFLQPYVFCCGRSESGHEQMDRRGE